MHTVIYFNPFDGIDPTDLVKLECVDLYATRYCEELGGNYFQPTDISINMLANLQGKFTEAYS